MFKMQITARYPAMRFSILECPWHPHTHPHRQQQEQCQQNEDIQKEAITEQPTKTGKVLEEQNAEDGSCPSFYTVLLEQTIKIFCLSLLG